MNLDFTGSTLFLVLLLFAAGLVCIIKGGDFFVDAATWIAEASGIPKFIIGATVVSFATTMPEMLVSVFSALEGNADIAVGNAVGSVTANTGLIMCLSLICMECTMPRRQYAVKAVLLLAAIAVLFGFTRDGQLSILESVLILVIFVCFIAESLVSARREQSLEAPEQDACPKTDGRTVALNIGKFVFGAAAIVLGAQLLIRERGVFVRQGIDLISERIEPLELMVAVRTKYFFEKTHLLTLLVQCNLGLYHTFMNKKRVNRPRDKFLPDWAFSHCRNAPNAVEYMFV